jgi:polyhydroxyalkanoate synthesis repressor PhaR
LCPPFLFILHCPKLSLHCNKTVQKGEKPMAETAKPLLIKRYASRRLYNTETSDYVTLEDIAGFIRSGREVQIIDLKSGDDLTRQYLLQIVAEHESKGDTVLPTNVLTDLVRSYTSNIQSVVPQFLAASFEMLREGPTKVIENMTAIPNPLTAMPGFDLMRKQQEAFMKTMMGGVPGWGGSGPAKDEPAAQDPADELAEIKKQFAELQQKLSKL